jgi:hypothetical protein
MIFGLLGQANEEVFLPVSGEHVGEINLPILSWQTVSYPICGKGWGTNTSGGEGKGSLGTDKARLK